VTTVAEAVADVLYAAGVRMVFGLPGGETVELMDALRRRGFEFVLVHSESSALFMADAYARLSGKVGVCSTTLGPGATNAVVGVAHAYLDRGPVLIFTAQKQDSLLPGYTHQVIDQHALFAPITKATVKLGPTQAAGAVAGALALAANGRPGPVHLQLSNEDAALETDDVAAVVTGGSQPSATHAGDVALAAAIQHITQASRPLIVAGLGLEPRRPYDELRTLAEALNAPVITTPKGKGALPDDHPLAAGTIGLTRTDPAYELLDEADCVIAVGFDVVELVRPWQCTAPLIWVAPWPNQDPKLPAVAELTGDLCELLHQLAKASPDPDPDWGSERVAHFRAGLDIPLPKPEPGRLLSQEVLASLRRALPAGAPLVVDVGSHKIHSSLSWPTLTPNRFLVSNGLSSMGYGLPGAMGAALALPGQPVVCLTGDAGLAMVLGELAVLARLRLPVVVIVLNDGAIDLIRAQQVRAGKPVYGTEFPAHHFAQVAIAYGLPGQRVSHVAGLERALATALNQHNPFLIEVMLDPTSYPTTPRHLPKS
jgi:acetolactate synthase-1/2/3 large subunit